jgi:hypothetical protein
MFAIGIDHPKFRIQPPRARHANFRVAATSRTSRAPLEAQSIDAKRQSSQVGRASPLTREDF